MMLRSIGLLAGTLLCAGAVRAAPTLEFRSGFWLNLHQFLFHLASAADAPPSDSPEWRAALEFYRREVVPHGLNDPDPAALNRRLSAASSAELAAGLDAPLAAVFAQTATAYRREWGPAHERANRAWIAAVEPLVTKYGDAMSKDITAAYGVEGPAVPIITDVAAFARPHGAYTTVNPPHNTVSSTDPGYQAPAALEMLFHEMSHTLDEKLSAALSAELAKRNRLFRRRGFEHAIIFYTAGEIARRFLPGYQTYGSRHGTWGDDGWPGALQVLEKDWKSYLDGSITFAAAIEAVVADYGVPQNLP